MEQNEFLKEAPTAYPVFYRAYSRQNDTTRKKESLEEVKVRTLAGIEKLGKLDSEELNILRTNFDNFFALPSGRALWCLGTEWAENPNNFYGLYNCHSSVVKDIESFRQLMILNACGCGTGAVLEEKNVSLLPPILHTLSVEVVGSYGAIKDMPDTSIELVESEYHNCKTVVVWVGDSKEGWADAYTILFELAMGKHEYCDPTEEVINVEVNISRVRAGGEPLVGFGGVANPRLLDQMFYKVANLLNKANGRQLTAIECCMLIDYEAEAIVAGNIRRCLAGNSLVRTALNGQTVWKRIDEITTGELITVPDDENVYTVTAKFYSGYQSIWEIISIEGQTIRCSKNHRIFVIERSMLTDSPQRKDFKCIAAWEIDPSVHLLLSPNSDYTSWRAVPIKLISKDLSREKTWDIEVDRLHMFICNNILVHNSASMRQFDDDEPPHKLGLYKQVENEDGTTSWVVDKDKECLRMSNHTNVFHHKPSLKECVDAVRLQYQTGEGAIQWAGEAVARANVDIINTEALRIEFLNLYSDPAARRNTLSIAHTNKYKTLIPVEELEHRESRYGLNPCGEILLYDAFCVTGDTFIITKDGGNEIKNLVGKEVEIWNGEQWSKVKPVKTRINSTLVRVKLNDGSYIDCTPDHKWLVKDRFNNKYTTVEAKDLLTVSKYKLHTPPVKIAYETGIKVPLDFAYTLGVAMGDGTVRSVNLIGINLYNKKRSLEIQGDRKVNVNVSESYSEGTTCDRVMWRYSPRSFNELRCNPAKWQMFYKWSKESILQFIAGLADTDGSNTDSNGIRIYISEYQYAMHIKRLLLKCGINSSVSLMSAKGTPTNFGVRSKDMYYVTITDCKELPCQRLDISNGKPAKCKGKWQCINSVTTLDNNQDVYCFEEPLLHQGVFNCSLTMQCNLSEVHANMLDPNDIGQQKSAIEAGALWVASLLHHKFPFPRWQKSRDYDPIVAVGVTGIFDFFVNKFGRPWLEWWLNDRSPDFPQAKEFKAFEVYTLQTWREQAKKTITEYCAKHNLKVPNRYTCVKPSGTQSLLTNASPGWHPPKATRFIRRVGFAAYHPVALACLDYGYSCIPNVNCTDDDGRLLDDIYDPRSTEWLVEIPVEMPWASVAEGIDPNQFSVKAQFDFFMTVQNNWTTHQTSSTIELREYDRETLGTLISEAIQFDQGYVSTAILGRFDSNATFPRLPYEPIELDVYNQLLAEVENRRKVNSFKEALDKYTVDSQSVDYGPNACDGEKCELR